jgi:4-amino-4-deoxy-L-arabinose transferase-like glycosyltransferase
MIACAFLFAGRSLPLIWISFGLVEVITFFYFSNLLTHRWANISYSLFRKELFTTALAIRIIYVVFAYFFYQFMTGKPFEFEAGDSLGYHDDAMWIVDMFESGTLGPYFSRLKHGVSDAGFSMWLSVIYYFSFKSILVARLVNAVIGAWTCVFIYKLARRNFGEHAGRISAVMAMLLPTLIYYCGLHTKETVMVFLLTAFAERGDNLIRTREFNAVSIIWIIFLGLALFFFRTALAVAAWVSLFSAILISANKLIGLSRRVMYIVLLAIAVLYIFSGAILMEIEGLSKNRTTNQQSKMALFSTRKDANNFARYGTTAIFAPLILFAPFTTQVDIPEQENSMLINGNNFTRNVYAFFVVIALLAILKKKLFTQHVLILSILLSYLAILAMSGYALSERFHMPAVPFLMIFAGYGITQMNNRNVKYYIPYLVIISIVIIGWNWFKLAGRGGGF